MSGFSGNNNSIGNKPPQRCEKNKPERIKEMIILPAVFAVTVTKAGWLAAAGAIATIYKACKED